MSELYLTPGIIEITGWLRGRPVDSAVGAHLLAMFGKDGEVARLAAAKKAAWDACPSSDDRMCHDHSCGYCQPFREGPLLDEVLIEIHSFESGNLYFNERGEITERDPEALPF
jgi:hypothetical protein